MLLSSLTISPYIIATIIALAYLWRFGGRWSWPCLIDAALLALYVARPGWPLLALILAFGIIRHTPVLAREVAVLVGLQAFDGWTLRVALVVLPGLLAYTDAPYQAATLPTMVKPSSTPAPAPAPQAEPSPMLLNEALAALNSDPTAPHLGVIGATRLGKTTFVGVLLAYRQSELVIATPKAQQYDPWFGADVARPVVQADEMSYAPIEQAVSSVYREMLHRNTPGGSDTPTITLVIDEWPQVVGELPSLAKKVFRMLRMGAGCGIRVILLGTDINGRGWKFEGEAGITENLIFAKVEGNRQWSIGRLDPNWRLVDPRRVDTGQVHGLAQRVILAGRGWVGARVSVPAVPDSLLGGLLAGVPPVGVGAPVVGDGGSPPDPRVQTHANTHTHTDADKRIAMYVEWRRAGIKKEQGRAIRRSAGDGLDDTEWAEAGKRLANGG